MNLELDLEQIDQLTRMIKSKDKENLNMAMTIIFNLDEKSEEVVKKKTELYQLIIDEYSWGEFMTLYKNHLKLFEKGFDVEFLKTIE